MAQKQLYHQKAHTYIGSDSWKLQSGSCLRDVQTSGPVRIPFLHSCSLLPWRLSGFLSFTFPSSLRFSYFLSLFSDEKIATQQHPWLCFCVLYFCPTQPQTLLLCIRQLELT